MNGPADGDTRGGQDADSARRGVGSSQREAGRPAAGWRGVGQRGTGRPGASWRGEGRRGPSFAEKRDARAAETDPAVVLAAAARFLEARPRSVAEVRRWLRSAGYGADLIEGAVARLVDLGILDDAAFARAWVESRDRARPRGERALRMELRQKGVGREETDDVLGERRDEAAARAEADGGGDGSDGGAGSGVSADEAAAERLLARRASQLGQVPDPRVRRQRAYALLARNGFDPGVCSSVAKRFAETADAGEADLAGDADDEAGQAPA